MPECRRVALIAAVLLATTVTLRPGVAAQRPPSAVREALAGVEVPLDRLEDQVNRYMGLTIAVEGTVDEVLGPRLFRVSDRTADGEVMVGVHAPHIAPVMAGDRVRITGRLQPFAHDEFERSWKWLGLDAEDELDLALHPVLVAMRVMADRGGASDLVLVTDAAQPVGTTGTAAPAARRPDLSTLAQADRTLVGQTVELRDVTVASLASPGGFFVQALDQYVLVLIGDGSAMPRAGERLSSVRGVLLEMPDNIEARLEPPGPLNDSVYVFTTGIGW